jgi:hypothetical protein
MIIIVSIVVLLHVFREAKILKKNQFYAIILLTAVLQIVLLYYQLILTDSFEV